MAKKKRRYSRKMTIPISMVAGFTPLVASGVRGWKNETFRGMGKELLFALTGVDIDNEPHFNPSFMINGTIPIVMGMVVHKLAGSLGINRALGRAGVPFLRI